MAYLVLTPMYIPDRDAWRVEWKIIGDAQDMEDAKRKFGGRPVLELRRGN